MSARSFAMDIGKGILVLVMLFHHAWTAIYIPGGNDSIRGVLSFVTSGFILFSGFLFGAYLLDGYIRMPTARAIRDVTRGVRLLCLYLAANILLYFSNYRGVGDNVLIEWVLLCMQPNPPEIVVFSLLNAFAYFFIVAALVFLCVTYVANKFRINSRGLLLLVVGMIFFALVLQFGMDANTMISSTTTYGFLGIIIGLVVHNLERHFDGVLLLAGSLGLSGFLVLSILTMTGVVNPYDFYPVFVLIASLAVWRLSCYLIKCESKLRGAILFLGQYTLLAYMLQVVVSQLMSLRIIDIYAFSVGTWQAFLYSTIVMATIMTGLLLVTARLRIYSRRFDSIYRFLFG